MKRNVIVLAALAASMSRAIDCDPKKWNRYCHENANLPRSLRLALTDDAGLSYPRQVLLSFDSTVSEQSIADSVVNELTALQNMTKMTAPQFVYSIDELHSAKFGTFPMKWCAPPTDSAGKYKTGMNSRLLNYPRLREYCFNDAQLCPQSPRDCQWGEHDLQHLCGHSACKADMGSVDPQAKGLKASELYQLQCAYSAQFMIGRKTVPLHNVAIDFTKCADLSKATKMTEDYVQAMAEFYNINAQFVTVDVQFTNNSCTTTGHMQADVEIQAIGVSDSSGGGVDVCSNLPPNCNAKDQAYATKEPSAFTSTTPTAAPTVAPSAAPTTPPTEKPCAEAGGSYCPPGDTCIEIQSGSPLPCSSNLSNGDCFCN